MTTPRKKQIRRQILEILSQASPYLLLEPILQSSLTLVISPRPLDSEFEEVISRMEKDRVVIRLRLDDEVKTRITDEGKAELL